MISLRLAAMNELDIAMDIIDSAKAHLKTQGIDQWQTGYPDEACIKSDILAERGFFAVEGDEILGYLCVDYVGEPAYRDMRGTWNTAEDYVVVHRMAFSDKARGKGASSAVFQLVEDMSRERGITSFRVDTDEGNKKMQHVLKKSGFTYCGTIWFDSSEKIAFDKRF